MSCIIAFFSLSSSINALNVLFLGVFFLCPDQSQAVYTISKIITKKKVPLFQPCFYLFSVSKFCNGSCAFGNQYFQTMCLVRVGTRDISRYLVTDWALVTSVWYIERLHLFLYTDLLFCFLHGIDLNFVCKL